MAEGRADEPVELAELGPADLPAIEALLGARADGARWVGVRRAERIVAVAGWAVADAQAHLVGLALEPGLPEREWTAALIGAVEELAADDGLGWLVAEGVRRRLPEVVDVPSGAAMQALGRHLAALFRPGDLVIATGDLGAGKTTLAQGIGAGLGVAEPVTSPTFVLSRIHPGGYGRPDLVHVDAYRLGDAAELDDIDLDHDLDRSVTVIEWGAGLAEQLAEDRLEIDIRRSADPADESRLVILRAVGARWDGVRLTPAEGFGS